MSWPGYLASRKVRQRLPEGRLMTAWPSSKRPDARTAGKYGNLTGQDRPKAADVR
jgi:hypothetical protein